MSNQGYQPQPLRNAVAGHVGGGTPSRQVPSFWRGQIPWASVKDFPEQSGIIDDTEEHISTSGLNASASNLISAGTPLVCTRMAVGRAAMPSVPMAINQDVKAIFPAPGISPAYLLKLLQFIQPKAEAQAVGSTVKGIRIQEYLDIKAPIAETDAQPTIARVLDTLDTAIHETEAIIAKLKAIKHGLLHDLLTRGIDANGVLRPPQAEAPHLYKESPLGWIPKEWDFAPLVSKIDFPEGQVDPRRVPYRDWVLIAPDHIESVTGRLISTATAAEQQAISGKYVFQSGDVIYSKIRPYLRKAVLASNSGLCSADMYPLRPKTGIDSRYLLAVILGDQYSRFAESVSMRSGFPKINRNEMAEFSIGWPSSDEQSWVAHILSDADIKQRTEEDQLEKLRLLKAGLMDDLLTGRVRVTPLLAEAAQQTGSA